MNKFFSVVFALVVLAFISPAQAQEPVFSIENVTGDLYRFQSNDYYGVFLVTDEGILLVDPISTATATWLKGEFETRFDKKVKVIIYSHHHADHISGAEVFLDTVEVIIAHEAAREKINEEGIAISPTHSFSSGTFVELGGQRVNLYYFNAPHTNNLVSVYFGKEKAIFLADIFYVNSIYWPDFEKTSVAGAVVYIQRLVENLEIEIAIPSHGGWGKLRDLVNYKEFIKVLNQEVSTQMIAGKTVKDIQDQPISDSLSKFPEFLEILPRAKEAVYNRYYRGEYFPLIKANPKYPRLALEKGKCGRVMVEYDVKADGTTENIKVVEAEPRKVFDRVSINAAKKYTYFTLAPIEGVRTNIYFGLEGACHWEFK